MTINRLLELLENKPIYNITNAYAYMLSFKIGTPFLDIKRRKETHSLFKKMEKYIFDQNYYVINISGEINFFSDKFWEIKLDNIVICDANYEHNDAERILGFTLDGHSINNIEIIKGVKNSIKISFSNGMALYSIGDEKRDGEIAFFLDKEHTFVINSLKGYKYCLNNDSEDNNWNDIII
jgi:hypothetical protein